MALFAIMNAEMAMVVMALCAGRNALIISAMMELIAINLTLMAVALALLVKISVYTIPMIVKRTDFFGTRSAVTTSTMSAAVFVLLIAPRI